MLLQAVPADVPEHRVPLRHPGETPARAGVPEFRRRDPPDRRTHRQERGVPLRRRPAGLRRFPEPEQDATQRHLSLRDRTRRRHWRGDRHAVERQLPGAGLRVHEQHPAGRRGHAHRGLPRWPDPHAEPVHRAGGAPEEGAGLDHRGRCARGTDRRGLGEGTGPEVLVADEGQAGVQRGKNCRRTGTWAAVHRVPGRTPGRRPQRRHQDDRRRAGAGSGAQGAGDDPPQGRARHRGAAGETRGLPGEGPGALRDLPGRGRLRRRIGQTGPGPADPGGVAAPRQDPERREGALRQDAVVAGGRDPGHGARLRYRPRRVRPGEAPLSLGDRHDGRGRRRLPHPHAAADVLLPADARTHRERARLHRTAAALQGEARPAGAVRQGRRRTRRLFPALGARPGAAVRERGRAGDARRVVRGPGAALPGTDAPARGARPRVPGRGDEGHARHPAPDAAGPRRRSAGAGMGRPVRGAPERRRERQRERADDRSARPCRPRVRDPLPGGRGLGPRSHGRDGAGP